MTTATSDATTITHRYPWTVEELGSIVFLLLAPPAACFALGWWSRDLVIALVVTVAGALAAAGLYRLGARRKKKSEVTGVLTGTRLVVSGGRVGSSRGDIAGTRAATTLTLGPETVLVLASRDGGSLRVPMRLAADEALRAVLRQHVRRDGVELSADARDALASL